MKLDITSLPHILEIPYHIKISNNTFLEICDKPFVLKNGMKDTVAMKRLDFVFFGMIYGDKEVVVYRTGNRNDFKKMYLKEYINYIFTTKDEKPYYLLDWFLNPNCKELKNYYSIPSYFKSWISNKSFLSFYIGPKNSASILHVDIMSTSAWNAVFKGKKLWIFYPPEEKRKLYNGKVDPFNPDYNKHPLFTFAKGIVCIQEEGDIVYTPAGWWHCVMNMEHTISLTDNFINSSNIKRVIINFFPSLIHLIKRTWVRRKQKYNW